MPEKKATKLTKQRILDAAIKISERENIEQVSIRKIAAELGSGAMSIYRHFKNRDDIMRHLMARVIESYAVYKHDEADDKTWIINTFVRIHSAFYDYPELMRSYFNDLEHHRDESMATTEAILQRLRSLGVNSEQSVTMFQTLLLFTAGCAMNDRMVDKINSKKVTSIKQLMSNDIHWLRYPLMLRCGLHFLDYGLRRSAEKKISRLLDSLLASP